MFSWVIGDLQHPEFASLYGFSNRIEARDGGVLSAVILQELGQLLVALVVEFRGFLQMEY